MKLPVSLSTFQVFWSLHYFLVIICGLYKRFFARLEEENTISGDYASQNKYRDDIIWSAQET